MVVKSGVRSKNLTGIAFMTAGMTSGALVDAVIKGASSTLPPTQLVIVAGFGMVTTCAGLAMRQGRPLISPAAMRLPVLLRTALEVAGVFGIIVALAFVPLTTVTVLTQSTPLLVTLGAVLFMGERASRTDWIVLAIGVAGMLLVVRPGFEGFQSASAIVIVAVLALSGRDLVSRAVPPEISTAQLGVWGGGALCLVGLLVSVATRQPLPPLDPRLALQATAIIVFSGATFYGITAAMRTGDVAVISPFRYTRLVVGVALGIVFFGESLDALMLTGTVLIIAAGLYALRRELRKKTRES